MDLAFLFRRMVREGNSIAATTLMDKKGRRLRDAILEHDRPADLLYVTYDKLGARHGKLIFDFVTKEYDWYSVGQLFCALLAGDAINPELMAHATASYRESYEHYAQLEGNPGDDEDDEYTPSYMWEMAIESAVEGKKETVSYLVALVSIGIEQVVSARTLPTRKPWPFRAIRDDERKRMPGGLLGLLSGIYAAKKACGYE